MPESEIEIRETKSRFYKIGGFPAVIGTIDYTHVRIQSPDANFGEQYRNRKGYFSLNVQVVGNADLKVLDIEARWPGSVHDQTIFDASSLKVRFERNDFDKSVLLGDGGYALKKYLLTPLTNPQNYAEKKYQKAQIKTRNIVERLFGVLKHRFPTLSLGLRAKISTTLTTIVACAVLHNIAIDLKDPFDDFDEVNDLGSIELPPLNDDGIQRCNSTVRDALIRDYFSQN